MSITDELRKWGYGFCGDTHDVVTAIADRIDAEHERLMDEQYKSLTVDMKPMTDENMAADGWIRLPVDADGEYILVGEAVTCGATVWTVTGLKFLGKGWGICCTVYNEHGGSGTSVYPPSDLRHYHAPTVEDVLFSYGQSCIRISNEAETDAAEQTMLAKLREEYAAKLRLAGDTE